MVSPSWLGTRYPAVRDLEPLAHIANYRIRPNIVQVPCGGNLGEVASAAIREFYETQVKPRIGWDGAVNITIRRLRAGDSISSHRDGMLQVDRYHAVLKGEPGCEFFIGDESIEHHTGDLWRIRNLNSLDHGAVNRSQEDRIIAMIDVEQRQLGAFASYRGTV